MIRGELNKRKNHILTVKHICYIKWRVLGNWESDWIDKGTEERRWYILFNKIWNAGLWFHVMV